MSHRRPRRLQLALLILSGLLAASACSSGGSEDAPPGSAASSTGTDAPSAPSSSDGKDDAAAASAPIRATFFGMHDGRVNQGTAPDGAVGAVRLWDAGTNWREIETRPGQFAWGPLDTAVATVEASEVRPLLVLGQTPTFHASQPRQEAAYGPGAASMPELGAWRRYVTAVAERYGDRIDYQVWNETNVVGYWAGTPQQMATLTLEASRAIRAVVPEATIVAPAFALRLPGQRHYFAKFWAQQADGTDLASAVDAVSVHLYPPAEDPPEAQVGIFDDAQDVLASNGVDLPVWDTEINFGLLGGPTPPAIPAERQRAFLMRTYLLNAGLGVQRVYWYRWDLPPIANTLLTGPDLTTPTLAGTALATVRAWLIGARVTECAPSAGVWACEARQGDLTRTFWWKPTGRPTVLPAIDGAESWTDADGHVTRCRNGCEVPVGETPVMVTSR